MSLKQINAKSMNYHFFPFFLPPMPPFFFLPFSPRILAASSNC